MATVEVGEATVEVGVALSSMLGPLSPPLLAPESAEISTGFGSSFSLGEVLSMLSLFVVELELAVSSSAMEDGLVSGLGER